MKQVVVIEKLTEVIPNKYEAVRVAAKEARRINSILIRSPRADSQEKPTVMALSRLLENKIKYKYVEAEPAKPLFEEGETQ